MVSDILIAIILVALVVFQSALRFAVVSDLWLYRPLAALPEWFQSALRFAVVSDADRNADAGSDPGSFNPL